MREHCETKKLKSSCQITCFILETLSSHEDISTTEIYAETDPEMAAEAISKMLGKQPVRKWDFLTEDEKLKLLGLK